MRSHRPLLRAGLAVLALSSTSLAAVAQVVLNTPGPNYIQNFNNAWTTSATPSTPAWANNSTIPGWYLQMNAVGTPSTITTQATVNGTGAGPIFLISHDSVPDNFALTARVSDANGSTPTTPGSGYYFGLLLLNSTGATITQFSLAYTGLQFYRSTGTSNNAIVTSYRTQPGNASVDLTGGSWNDLSALTYTAPQAGGTAAALNFNIGNFTNFAPATASGLSWANGDSLMVRWYINNVTGVDQGVGIDNVMFSAVTAVPELATQALLLLGLGAVGLARGSLNRAGAVNASSGS